MDPVVTMFLTGLVAAIVAASGGGLMVWTSIWYLKKQRWDELAARSALLQSRPCPRAGGWLRPPEVLLHNNCPVDLWRVECAVAYWRSLGHAFGEVKITKDPTSVRGAILVIGTKTGNKTSMVTQIATKHWVDPIDLRRVTKGDYYCRLDEISAIYSDGQIDHAVVTIPPLKPGVNIDLLLIHRLGHALGYHHVDAVPIAAQRPNTRRVGHVMSALLPEYGWNHEGLRVTKPAVEEIYRNEEYP